jgi:DegV family protein with EDD domain
MEQTPQKLDFASSLSESLSALLRLTEISFAGKPKDVTFKEMMVLHAVIKSVSDGHPVRSSDIAASLHMDRAAFREATGDLQRKGYLVRLSRSEGTCTVIRIAATEKGAALREAYLCFLADLQEALREKLTEEEKGTFLHGLKAVDEFAARLEELSRRASFQIVTDSASDISPEEAKALGIEVAPLSVFFGDQAFKPEELPPERFYEKLKRSPILPTTAQLTPWDLEHFYSKAHEGNKEILAIHLGSSFSGTYQSAVIAAKAVRGVHVVDSGSASIGQALLVRAAVKLKKEGKSIAEIEEVLAGLKERLRLVAFVSSLKNFVRGGRISAAAGVLGSALNLCPILRVVDGAIINAGKVRGKESAYRELSRIIGEDGVDESYGVAIGHAGEPKAMEACHKVLGENSKLTCDFYDYNIGSVIGTHSGAGAAGIAYIAKK